MEENTSKNASKSKERRQPFSADGMPKRINKPGLIKKDLSQLPPPPPLDNNSPVKKILNEANKIVKIGMEKEFALLERDKTLQNSSETVDNLRKNILHLQMEYEKLDQNYQREITYRSEMMKRMDATREMVESVSDYSNKLSNSLKQLEADKLKIAEFYELIYQNQKEVEAKHLEVDKFIKEMDELLKTNREKAKRSQEILLSQHSETVSQLNKKFNYANDRLKVVANENEKLQRRIQEYEESLQKLEASFDQQQKLNCQHEEDVAEFRCTLRKLKIQRFKYQKMWKRKKMQVSVLLRKNKILRKGLKETEMLHIGCESDKKTLELANIEWEQKFEKHLEEVRLTRLNWEYKKTEMNEKLLQKETEIESLKAEKENLSGKFNELTKSENSKQSEIDRIQTELSKLLSENLKLKDDVMKLREENKNKEKLVMNLERKSNSSNAELNSRVAYYQKESERLQELVGKLESQLTDMEKSFDFEKKQREAAVLEFESKLEEKLRAFKQRNSDLEKLLEEKTACLEKLESERSQTALESLKSLEKLTNQLQAEKLRNQELSKSFESLKFGQEDSKKQLEKSKNEISELLEKLAEADSLNRTLKNSKKDWEATAASLKGEIELRKKALEVLEDKNKNAEKEISKMEKMAEENAALKSSVAELKSLLEATEAKVEAYKVVVKKLESEKVEARNIHSEEVSRFKSELARLEEASKSGKDSHKILVETPKKSVELTNKKEAERNHAKTIENTFDLLTQKPNTKENDPEIAEIENWRQTATPPLQSGKKFLSTPRKIYTSTPQSGFRSLTPAQKRDPYEFDSDSSVERFDQDKVLKVFNRQKRETNKRSKKK